MFSKATKQRAKLRLALQGPAGSGKTWSALTFAREFGDKIAVIDTEHGSASKYAGDFDFDVCELDEHHHTPEDYIKALRFAQDHYDVVIVDSLTHEWDWCLREVDRVAAAKFRGNSYAAWGEVTPRHNSLRDAILAAQCHVIATMRSKTEYVLTENARGKSAPTKVGMKAVQRDGLDYEFDVVCEFTVDHIMAVTKSRCSAVADHTETKPGQRFASTVRAWLDDGAEPPPPPLPPPSFEMVCRLAELAADDAGLQRARDAANEARSTLNAKQVQQVRAVLKLAQDRVAAAEREPGCDDEMDPPPPDGVMTAGQATLGDYAAEEEAANG